MTDDAATRIQSTSGPQDGRTTFGPSRFVTPLVETERVGLESESDSCAAFVYLNRPESLNAISWDMVLQLESALQAVDDDAGVAIVFISGRGRGFSAGGDLKGYLALQRSAENFSAFVDDFHRVLSAIKYMSKPVVALVNGVTAAGGLELLLSCDFAWAASSARIGDAHLNYGQIGGGGSLALLPRVIGPTRARELLFSGELLPAAEALDWGLVNRVIDDAELFPAAIEYARSVAAKSPAGVARAKWVLNVGWDEGTGLPGALRVESEATKLWCLTRPDSRIGLEAFAAKKKPKFPGR
jgi:enoyl-CoA hydratase/carnithine racemase